MESINAIQQVLAPLGVYAVTVIILILGILKLWTFINNLIERLFKIVENNTQAMKDNKDSTDALIERFDDFVRNGHK